jgi:DNA-binding XRE family transcriptional regulator
MMPQANPDNDELKQRAERAREWKLFRRNNMLTQVRLAAMIGVSRRTIQQVENRHLTPHIETMTRFAAFKRKYDMNAGRELIDLTLDEKPKRGRKPEPVPKPESRRSNKWQAIPTM